MPTLAQIEAARRNGAKSKGPVTAEGKQSSAQNAVRHGLSAKRLLVLSNECDETFVAFLKQFEEKLKPVDQIEHGFVLQAAAARWRLRRAWIIETGLIDMKMDAQQSYMQKTFTTFDEGTRQAVAFRTLVDETRALDLIGRYEARLSREYERAIRGLDRIRAERNPNAPATPVSSSGNPKIESDAASDSAGSPKLPNEPNEAPSEADFKKLQNEPKHSAESDTGVLTVDPRHAGIIDTLLAHPSVRAVLDPPEKIKAA
jgi:hypothetical protein